MPEFSAKNNKKVAVVTGANRGIGLQVVKNLGQQLDPSFDVLLTSRNEERGQEALKQVTEAGKNANAPVKFHQLDVDDHKSIENLRNDLRETYGGLDILVQNAAIFLHKSDASNAEIAETTVKTNYWSVRDICCTLLPIMRQSSRLVIVASRLGVIYLVKCAETRKRLLSDNLELEELDKIMQSYVDAAKARDGNGGKETIGNEIWDDKAFHQPHGAAPRGFQCAIGAYSAAKVGVIALARVLQRKADAMKLNIIVTSCCPGSVATDMNEKGAKTVEEGADTPTYLALLSESDDIYSSCKGQLVAERQVMDWGAYEGQTWE